MFESVVGQESHARLDRISNDKSSTASVHPAYALRAQRLADYREWRLALDVMVVLEDARLSPCRIGGKKKRKTHFSTEL